MGAETANTTQSQADRQRVGLVLLVAALVGLAIRVPLLLQSLWYDEMYSLLHYMLQGWGSIVSGDYSPNNHILYTLLGKLSVEAFGTSMPGIAARLPSLIAGLAVPLLLAWPLRHGKPKTVAVLALLGMAQPWLASISGWARGYTLLLALCVGGTLLLSSGRWKGYVLAMAGALYTHPLAILVVGAQGVMLLALKTQPFRRWLIAAAVVGVISAMLYTPFLAGAGAYFSQPQKPSLGYREFIAESFRYAHAGGALRGWIHVLVAVLVCTAGAAAAWRWRPLRGLLLTFGVASVLGMLVPLAVPAAGEVRAMVWLIPLYILGMFGLVAGSARWMPLLAIVPLAFFSMRLQQIMAEPAQPVQEAIAEARTLAGDHPVVGVYMASAEARALYGGIDAVAYDLPGLQRLAPAHPTLLLLYPGYIHRDQQEMWRYLGRHYETVRVLDGRISPALIMEPRPAAAPSTRP